MPVDMNCSGKYCLPIASVSNKCAVSPVGKPNCRLPLQLTQHCIKIDSVSYSLPCNFDVTCYDHSLWHFQISAKLVCISSCVHFASPYHPPAIFGNIQATAISLLKSLISRTHLKKKKVAHTHCE